MSDVPTDGELHETSKSSVPIDSLSEHIRGQLDDFRQKLLDPTFRKPLVSFSHIEPSTAFIRIIDELPDQVLGHLEEGHEFVIRSLDPPLHYPYDEETEDFQQELEKFKADDPIYREEIESRQRKKVGRREKDDLERKARDRVRFQLSMDPWKTETDLSLDERARRKGLNPDFDLPEPDSTTVLEHHADSFLQTLLDKEILDARLEAIRNRAMSSLSDMGIPTLFAAFGFLEWYEDDHSDRERHSPLILLPLELHRRKVGQQYQYSVQALDEKAEANRTLELVLRERFGVVLPSFVDDETPEGYFRKLKEICDEKAHWGARRFVTIGLFPFAKMAIYDDLDVDRASPSADAVIGHEAIRKMVASAGDAESPAAEEYELDDPEIDIALPPLIYDADSSQHSAIIDALSEKNVAIHGPPGTGKSQTITNIIDAAIGAGKSVLFVSEKMAALDVVSDRMNKARLENFCLKLHTNPRKKTILEDYKIRLEMSRPSFDLATLEQGKVQWREERNTLKSYVDLIKNKIGKSQPLCPRSTLACMRYTELGGRRS